MSIYVYVYVCVVCCIFILRIKSVGNDDDDDDVRLMHVFCMQQFHIESITDDDDDDDDDLSLICMRICMLNAAGFSYVCFIHNNDNDNGNNNNNNKPFIENVTITASETACMHDDPPVCLGSEEPLTPNPTQSNPNIELAFEIGLVGFGGAHEMRALKIKRGS